MGIAPTRFDNGVNNVADGALKSLPVLAPQHVFTLQDDFYWQDSNWTTSIGAGGSIGINNTPGAGGWIRFVTDGDNNDHAVLHTGTHFTVVSGKQLWMETRMRFARAADCQIFFGLSSSGSDPESGSERFLFQKTDGSSSDIVFSVDDGTTETNTETVHTIVADEPVKLGVHYNKGNVNAYVNDKIAGRLTQPPVSGDSTFLSFAVGVEAKNGGGAMTGYADYVFIAQEIDR